MVIGLDIGSSSAKAILLDRRGRTLRSARLRFPTRRGRGGRVEHDSSALLRAALAGLGDVSRGLPPGGRTALGIAVQRSTILFWDRDTGRAVTPAYSWQDLRAASLCRALRPRAGLFPGARRDLNEAVRARTGLRLSAHYAAAKLAWALRRVPGLRRRVASGRVLWGTLGTWLTWHLTQGAIYAVDHANAQRTLLFHLDTLDWDPALFELFGVLDLLDAPAVPGLVPTRMESGAVTSVNGRRLTIAAMTGDQQAALQGLLCRRAGDMAINYGSGAFVLVQVGSRPVRLPGLLTTLVDSRHLRPEEPRRPGGCAASYAVEGTVNAAATALDWAGRHIRRRIRTADLDRVLGAYDPQARRPVHFLPAVSGLGAPRWDERARPKFAPDRSAAGRVAGPLDHLRAAVESIAQRCAEIARAATPSAPRRRPGDTPLAQKAVRVSGGLTRCRYLMQSQADLLQRPILVTSTTDATAIGAALMAAGEAGRAMLAHPGRGGAGDAIIEPIASARRAAAMRRAWSAAVYGRGSAGRI